MRLSDSLTNVVVLNCLIDHMIGYRKRKGYVAVTDKLPKLQIKGMAGDVAKFRTDFQKTREAIAELNEARTGLHQDFQDATEQLTAIRSDLRFEMEQLGNGTGGSEEQSEKPKIVVKEIPLSDDSAASTESGH